MEAMRCLKRRLSDTVYRTMLANLAAHTGTGPGGQHGNDSDSSATGSHPDAGPSDKRLARPRWQGPGDLARAHRLTRAGIEESSVALVDGAD
jgi:transposase